MCYVEECANTGPCGLNMDLQPTNMKMDCVEMDYATGVMWLEVVGI